MASLPSVLALNRAHLPNGQPEHESLRLILRSHLLDCFEVMYWPFLQTVLNADASDSMAPSPQISPTVLSFAQKGLDVCIDRIEQTESGFRSRHHGTYLTLRSCTRSALVLMAVRSRYARSGEIAACRSLRLPGSLLIAVSKVIELLKFWQNESADVSDRLQILETLMQQELPSG